LAADGLHTHGETRENGVACDVSEADGEGTASEGELPETAEEEHGDEGAGVEEKAGEDHGEGNLENGKGLFNGQGEMGIGIGIVSWFVSVLLRDQWVCEMMHAIGIVIGIGRLLKVVIN